MKTTLIAALLTSVCVMPAFAAEISSTPQERNQSVPGRESRAQGSAQTVAQKKTEIIQHIEARITSSQAEKVCVQSAQSHDELRSCREKYRPQKPPEERQTQQQ